jgi:alanyl-tRNA synthetase
LIGGYPVVDVIDEENHIVHVLSEPVIEGEVECEIDWARRFDHMQQHTGQHLLSAVFADLYGFQTVSFHMGAASSTIDLACPGLTTEQIATAEARANAIVQANRAVSVTVENADSVSGLRKTSDRTGPLRIVEIDDLDRSACGGTHVRFTGEIGVILLRCTDKIRGNVRLEFLCGGRAVSRARADYTALESAARVFSAPIDEVPGLVATQAERLKDIDKSRRKLETELAEYRGRALHATTVPDERGLRTHVRVLTEGPFPNDLRAEANAYVSAGKAVFIAMTERPPAVMLASAADSGVHAGNVLKSLFAESGGKGGGSAQMAQGSFTSDPHVVAQRLNQLLSIHE